MKTIFFFMCGLGIGLLAGMQIMIYILEQPAKGPTHISIDNDQIIYHVDTLKNDSSYAK